MDVQNRTRHHSRQRKKTPLVYLVVPSRMLLGLLCRIRVQPNEVPIRTKDFAVQEIHLLLRGRIGNVEIAEFFAFESQYLDVLVLIGGEGWFVAQDTSDLFAKNDAIRFGVLFCIN